MSQVKGSGRAPWQPPEADLGMIERALGILMAPGSLVELRIPNTPRRGTVSGYFNDLGKMAASAAIMSGKAEGVYLTLNPVKPNLLARAANRLIDYSKHTTANHDVMHLWSFLIDLDPVRPSGISSTDAEHEAAQERARKCRDWLSTQGWPEPVFADSGNGAHLCYRVELPNNNNSSDLLRRCLEALALLLTDQTVEVDLGTYNSARLVKVYGTLAAKGESLRERPHGLARLLEVPAALVAVPLEKFEALARRIPKTEARTAAGQRRQKNDGFDLQRWIDLHNPDVDSPTDWNGGKRWILRRCLWNPDHRDRSAYIVQFGNGAIAAGCHHKSCEGKDWQALRDLVEPGCRAPKPDGDSGKRTEEAIPPPEDRVAASGGRIAHADCTLRSRSVTVPELSARFGGSPGTVSSWRTHWHVPRPRGQARLEGAPGRIHSRCERSWHPEVTCLGQSPEADI